LDEPFTSVVEIDTHDGGDDEDQEFLPLIEQTGIEYCNYPLLSHLLQIAVFKGFIWNVEVEVHTSHAFQKEAKLGFIILADTTRRV